MRENGAGEWGLDQWSSEADASWPTTPKGVLPKYALRPSALW